MHKKRHLYYMRNCKINSFICCQSTTDCWQIKRKPLPIWKAGAFAMQWSYLIVTGLSFLEVVVAMALRHWFTWLFSSVMSSGWCSNTPGSITTEYELTLTSCQFLEFLSVTIMRFCVFRKSIRRSEIAFVDLISNPLGYVWGIRCDGYYRAFNPCICGKTKSFTNRSKVTHLNICCYCRRTSIAAACKLFSYRIAWNFIDIKHCIAPF